MTVLPRSLAASVEAVGHNESGQGLLEYAAILVFVSTVAILVLGAIGADVRDLIQSVLDLFP
jgi:hypothetical protein